MFDNFQFQGARERVRVLSHWMPQQLLLWQHAQEGKGWPVCTI